MRDYIIAFIAWSVLMGLVGYALGFARSEKDMEPTLTEYTVTMARADGQLEMCGAIIEALNSDGKFFILNPEGE